MSDPFTRSSTTNHVYARNSESGNFSYRKCLIQRHIHGNTHRYSHTSTSTQTGQRKERHTISTLIIHLANQCLMLLHAFVYILTQKRYIHFFLCDFLGSKNHHLTDSTDSNESLSSKTYYHITM